MVRFSRVGLAAVPMCHPSVIRSWKLMRHDGGMALKSQDHCEGLRALPRKSMECENSHDSLLDFTFLIAARGLYRIRVKTGHSDVTHNKASPSLSPCLALNRHPIGWRVIRSLMLRATDPSVDHPGNAYLILLDRLHIQLAPGDAACFYIPQNDAAHLKRTPISPCARPMLFGPDAIVRGSIADQLGVEVRHRVEDRLPILPHHLVAAKVATRVCRLLAGVRLLEAAKERLDVLRIHS